MKKITSVFVALMIIVSHAAVCMAYTQYDIHSSITNAFAWMEHNASPLKTSDSAASDYYIMALAEMNIDYDYDTYVTYTQSRNPSTDKDGQRLIMATTACGAAMSDSYVKMYTYNKLSDNAADLAGAILTLDCGGYEVKSDTLNKDYMIVSLLSMQQSDGSFGGDVYTTARSILALSPYAGNQYKITGEHVNEVYLYNTESAILNAIAFLEHSQNPDVGFGTVTNTAYVIMALDSVGINADSDPAFVSNGVSPVSRLISYQQSDGSFSGFQDDTAIAVCALTSHLRAMQGKTRFFDFAGRNSLDPVSADTATDRSGEGIPAPKTSDSHESKAIVELTPPPTNAPEHSAMNAEEYGPFPFVGPLQENERASETAAPQDKQVVHKSGNQRRSRVPIIMLIISGILLILSIVFPFVYKKYAENLKQLAHHNEQKSSQPEQDLLKESDSHEDVVPKDELYSPDFIKTLIPVEHIDDTIGSIVDTGTDDKIHDENDNI